LLRDFDASAMYRVLAPDEIPSIDHPLLDPPGAARGLLPDLDLVIGFAYGREAHAYPIALLSLHEVVNDVVGGFPVAVTWCPLCQSAVGFDRAVDGRTLVFGVSGLLYKANQILFDRQTHSLWSQLLGGAVVGPLRGTALRPVPLVMESWGAWLADHPNTTVLSIRRDSFARRFTNPYSVRTDRGIQDSNDPYGAYLSKISAYFRTVHQGVQDGEYVLGLVVSGKAKAYPQTRLARHGVVDDAVGGVPVLAVHDSPAFYDGFFDRRIGGRTLTFGLQGHALVDRETRSRWDARSGRALSGPFAGTTLRRLPAETSLWFAWRLFHPQTLVYR
jgi:hypothetical protein